MTRLSLGHGIEIGTVYGALFNDRATLERLQPEFAQAPYKAPPQAPILYIKSRNTLAAEGDSIAIPTTPGEVRIDATIGLVISRTATRISPAQAMDFVAGYVLVSDLTLPHENYYRPAVVQRNRDGFCPISAMVQGDEAFNIDTATLTVAINQQPAYERSFQNLVRPAAQLIADVTEFMTLQPGDVLLLGPGEGSPVAKVGDVVTINVPHLGELTHTLVEEKQA